MPSPESDPFAIPDAPRDNVVARYVPVHWRPYAEIARFDRPIGWWLLLLPCWWSLTLASHVADIEWPSPWYALLFFVGAVVMRGAGCAYNDIVDRDIDASVARTRARPIPSGRLTTRRAVLFMGLLLLVGLAVLVQFNRFSIGLGFASLVPVLIYPFLKRFTGFPQVGLGLSFSWGALMGWAVVLGRLDWPALALYAATIAWTVGYDTIYAHQDREDDELIGLGSTARVFANSTPVMLTVCFGATVLLIGASFVGAGAGPLAFTGLVGFAVHLGAQVWRFDRDDGERCLAQFRSNRDAGLILLAGLLADGLIGSLA